MAQPGRYPMLQSSVEMESVGRGDEGEDEGRDGDAGIALEAPEWLREAGLRLLLSALRASGAFVPAQ